MNAVGFVFLSIDDGPVTSLPIQINTDKLVMEISYGTEHAASACPSVRALVEGILTTMHDHAPQSEPTPN